MTALLIGFAGVFVLILTGVPVAIAFGSLAFLLAFYFHLDPAFLLPVVFIKIRSVMLLAVPLFIMLGQIIRLSGMASKVIDVVNVVLGRFKGGLGAVCIVALAVFGAISGASTAGMACIGTITIPKMEENGYPRGYATALVACAGVVGQLIPPSIPLIFYAVLTGQTIPAVWLATVGPAIIVIILYCIMNWWMSRNFPLVQSPKLGAKAQVKASVKAIWYGLPVLFLPVLILGGIYGGIFTPTESAAIGVFYVLIMAGLFYRNFSFKELAQAIGTAAVTSGTIIIMVLFILIVSRVLVVEALPQQLASLFEAFSPNVYVTLLMVNVILLIMGMMMDDTSGTLLAATVLYPIVAHQGVNPLHFAAIVGVNLGLGNTTPPCAPCLFLAGRIGDCPAQQYMKPAFILMFSAMLPALVVTTYWPGLSLFLPTLAGYVH